MLNKLIHFFAPVFSPKSCYNLCRRLRPWLGVLSLCLIGYGVVDGLFIAPSDYQQGDAYRIIYIHVPFAILSLMFYAAVGVLSMFYLVWRMKLAELIAYSLAPIGAVVTILALVTGAIWGKPMWGTWWVWDARLTSELILLFLYVGYIALYDAIKSFQPKSIAPSVLAVVGLIDLPIIHYSVYWWQTLHQGATITRLAKPAIDNAMLIPLLAMIFGLLSLCLYILSIRVQSEILAQAGSSRWVTQKEILA